MNEIEYLKVVRHTVASCRDFSRVLRVSDSADEPHSTRSRHCHELFEIRLLFGMLDATCVDYETLREIRLSPAGVAHPGLFENEHPAHITVRFDVDMLYYLRGNGTDKLDRLRIRTPTFANIAPLLSMLVGCGLADVAVIILSIDPCVSCTER